MTCGPLLTPCSSHPLCIVYILYPVACTVTTLWVQWTAHITNGIFIIFCPHSAPETVCQWVCVNLMKYKNICARPLSTEIIKALKWLVDTAPLYKTGPQDYKKWKTTSDHYLRTIFTCPYVHLNSFWSLWLFFLSILSVKRSRPNTILM